MKEETNHPHSDILERKYKELSNLLKDANFPNDGKISNQLLNDAVSQMYKSPYINKLLNHMSSSRSDYYQPTHKSHKQRTKKSIIW